MRANHSLLAVCSVIGHHLYPFHRGRTICLKHVSSNASVCGYDLMDLHGQKYKCFFQGLSCNWKNLTCRHPGVGSSMNCFYDDISYRYALNYIAPIFIRGGSIGRVVCKARDPNLCSSKWRISVLGKGMPLQCGPSQEYYVYIESLSVPQWPELDRPVFPCLLLNCRNLPALVQQYPIPRVASIGPRDLGADSLPGPAVPNKKPYICIDHGRTIGVQDLP